MVNPATLNKIPSIKGNPRNKLWAAWPLNCSSPKIANHSFEPLQPVILDIITAAAIIIPIDINMPDSRSTDPIIVFFNTKTPLF
jgi:hypothetical protein